ncbi:MAG: sporulation protein [Oscillospiraceae bacterium]|nr:sporulation protein [Oscillospiraceae bacterium]
MEHLFDRLRDRTAETFDLPGDIIAGQPRMELVGSREFWMEGHRGILSYGTEEIHISGGRLVVCVRGSDLDLRAMNANTLCISGNITSVGLE